MVTDDMKRYAVAALQACNYTPHPDEKVVNWKYSTMVGTYEFITNYCNAFGPDGDGGYMAVLLDLKPGSRKAEIVIEVWDRIWIPHSLTNWDFMARYINLPSRKPRVNWLAVGILATAVTTALLTKW